MPAKTTKEYAERLREMIRIETVSNPVVGSPKENFEEFRELLRKLFPHIHEACEVREFDGSLLLKWPGRDKSLLPVMFMNHYDVVPAPPAGWTHPPFEGVIADGMIWGRGTLDTKGGLWGMLEAADELAAEGFVPGRDIYFESACNEETTGEGADTISAFLRDSGVRLDMVFDEGGDIVESPIAGVKGIFAMIGVGEKSVANLKFIARSEGGHASTPDKNTPIVRIGKFMNHVDKHSVFDVRLTPTISEMMRRLAPGMGTAGKAVEKVLTKADLLHKPLEMAISSLGATARALLSTTIAFTMTGGGDAINSIPREAWVIGNMRCSHHQGRDGSIRAITKLAAKYGLETEVLTSGYESRMTDFNGSAFKLVEEAVKATCPAAPVCAPYVMTGASDARFFDRICDQCIRFSPFLITNKQMGTIHGVDERLGLDSLSPAVDYYRYMMEHV